MLCSKRKLVLAGGPAALGDCSLGADNSGKSDDNAAMSDSNARLRWLPHRADQLAVAACVAAALVALAAWWATHGGWRAGLVEIDRAEPLTAKFEVDINTAEWPELLQLPGVGPKMAQRIIDSRQTLGPFADQDDLRRVPGIGPKTMERIRPYLRAMPDSKSVAGN